MLHGGSQTVTLIKLLSVGFLLLTGCEKRDRVEAYTEYSDPIGFERIVKRRYHHLACLGSAKDKERVVLVFDAGRELLVAAAPLPSETVWVARGVTKPAKIVNPETIEVSGIRMLPNGRKGDDFSCSTDVYIGFRIKRAKGAAMLQLTYGSGDKVDVPISNGTEEQRERGQAKIIDIAD